MTDQNERRHSSAKYEFLEMLLENMMSVNSRIVKENGLSYSSFFILKYLNLHGSQNLTALSKIMGTSKPTITSLIDGLVRKGLVERVSSSDDRRMYYVVISNEGKALIRKSREILMEIGSSMFEGVDEGCIKRIIANLVKINEINNLINREAGV